MKLFNFIQAVWPGFLLVGALSSSGGGGFTYTAIYGLWLCSAALLNPSRPWSWWLCLVPVVGSIVAGLGCIGGLVFLYCFPDAVFWQNSNQPGALLFIGILFSIIPALLLLWHLLVIRRQFSGVDTAA